MKKKYFGKVRIVAYYNLDGDYTVFEDNTLHNKEYYNVSVEIKTEKRKMLDISFESDVIYIEGEEPIECELVRADTCKGTLVLGICQDWG